MTASMTLADRIEAIVFAFDAGDSRRDDVRALAAEVRALPVMDVCGRCDDCYPALANGGAACMHPKIGYRVTVASDAPPSWCPLRGGER